MKVQRWRDYWLFSQLKGEFFLPLDANSIGKRRKAWQSLLEFNFDTKSCNIDKPSFEFGLSIIRPLLNHVLIKLSFSDSRAHVNRQGNNHVFFHIVTMGKKKSYIAYFYHNLVLLFKKYIKSITILKSFEKCLIWVVERNFNLKTLEVMLIWKKSVKLKSARYGVFY